MLRLSTKARYALRAMVELGLHEGEGLVQLRQVASAQDLSPKYLEQLTGLLRQAGLVHTERGPQGGYRLARPASEITALQVVKAVEGPLALLDCVADRAACPRSHNCAARKLWSTVSDAVTTMLGETTIAQLCDEQRLGDARRPSWYQI
jgi:Rrf2 family protein